MRKSPQAERRVQQTPDVDGLEQVSAATEAAVVWNDEEA
jgi:hypothetical protein